MLQYQQVGSESQENGRQNRPYNPCVTEYGIAPLIVCTPNREKKKQNSNKSPLTRTESVLNCLHFILTTLSKQHHFHFHALLLLFLLCYYCYGCLLFKFNFNQAYILIMLALTGDYVFAFCHFINTVTLIDLFFVLFHQ